ncbi:hypothetical protein B1742_21370 [Enterobacter kobei]|nr:hypothetical protein B1742_21370 [Enterobacter kobei]
MIGRCNQKEKKGIKEKKKRRQGMLRFSDGMKKKERRTRCRMKKRFGDEKVVFIAFNERAEKLW